MTKDEYKNYLNTPYWQNKKLEVINKQGKKCKICDSPYNLNIHHKRYKEKGKSLLYNERVDAKCFSQEDLIVLCNDCHFLWHDCNKNPYLGIIKIEIIRFLLNRGYSKTDAFIFPKTNKKDFKRLSVKFAKARMNSRISLKAD